jgi:hypothetical protein
MASGIVYVKPRDTVGEALKTDDRNVFEVALWLNIVDCRFESFGGKAIAVEMETEAGTKIEYEPGQWLVRDILGNIKAYADDEFHAMFNIRVA